MNDAQYAAGLRVLQTQMQLAASGRNLATAALAGSHRFVEWRHYPAADMRDAQSGASAFYHAHDAAARAAGEHGHFHVFSGGEGGYSHLVGLSLNDRGDCLRLFTTNRWVTAENWLPAERMVEALEAFSLKVRGRMAPVATWIEAMITLFAEEIVVLLQRRDAWVEARLADGESLENVLEDRSTHIVTELPVNLNDRLARLERAFESPQGEITTGGAWNA